MDRGGMADADADGAPPRAGRYLLGRVLGAGAMGVVRASFDPVLEREIAVKMLGPRDVAMLRDTDDPTRSRLIGTEGAASFTSAAIDDARLLEEASLAGVPTVLPAAATTGVDGFVSPFVQVESPDRAAEWTNALHHVLDDPAVREQRTAEARRRAESVDGPAAAKATVSRLMGWATYGAARAVVS
jgi:hypothetical protein